MRRETQSPWALLDARAKPQAEAVIATVERVLGDDLLGIYLHGSAVLGGLRLFSDLDLLVVSKRPTTSSDKKELIAPLLMVSRPSVELGPRSVELTLVVERDVRPWRFPPQLDFVFADWLRSAFETGDLAPWRTPNEDLAIVLTIARKHGCAFMGPPLTDLLDPVPKEHVMRAMIDGVPSLLEDLVWDTRNVLLTLARIWMTAATGEIQPKDVAAEWAVPRLSEEDRRLLARARAIYLGEERDRWDDVRGVVAGDVRGVVAGVAQHMVREIRSVFSEMGER